MKTEIPGVTSTKPRTM